MINDHAHSASRYAEALDERTLTFTGEVTLPHIGNLSIGEFRHTVSFALGKFGIGSEAVAPPIKNASFLFRVLAVVFGRTEKQVVGTHAGRDITAMQDPQPFRNRTCRQDIRSSAGLHDAIACPAKPSIAMLIKRASPQPARVGLIHFRPESLGQWRTRKDASRHTFFVSRRLKKMNSNFVKT